MHARYLDTHNATEWHRASAQRRKRTRVDPRVSLYHRECAFRVLTSTYAYPMCLQIQTVDNRIQEEYDAEEVGLAFEDDESTFTPTLEDSDAESLCASSENSCSDAESIDSIETVTDLPPATFPPPRIVNKVVKESLTLSCTVSDHWRPVFTFEPGSAEDFTRLTRPSNLQERVPECATELAQALMEAAVDMQRRLHISGRERKQQLLACLRSVLRLLGNGPDIQQTIEYALPECWETLERRLSTQPNVQVFTHRVDVTPLGQVQRYVNICTADPLPPLLMSLAKYSEFAYMGRGEWQEGQPVTPSKLWTTRLWKEVCEGVPLQGVPLMIKMYSDAFTAAGRSHHVFTMELAHFDTSVVNSLDLSVTAASYIECKMRKTGDNWSDKRESLSPFQRALKIQLLNYAAEAAISWLQGRATDGVTITLPDGRTLLVFPRLIAYDADQPELVSLVGKTCYMCWASKKDFSHECSVEPATPPLTAVMLRRLQLYANQGLKTKVAERGFRNPCASYRMWSPANSPFIDSSVGGFPRFVRADDLHITVLGTVKKFYEDTKALLTFIYGTGGHLKFEAALTQIVVPPIDTSLRLHKFKHGVWAVESPGGDDYTSFMLQAPEAIVRLTQATLEQESDNRLQRLLHAAVLARHVMVTLRVKRIFTRTDIQDLRRLTGELREALQGAFHYVRKSWQFPKFHTMTAFASQVNNDSQCFGGFCLVSVTM